ncbi:helix-turn-helix domain-containing protein [Belliella marina]|uniref:Helix-turn-helix domain-containing protein n=1 Tax=Belliella marina TaxID=1644146 RepID=A0ABW4VHX8_9BACT
METLLFVVTLQSLTTGLLIYLNKKFKGEDLFLSLFFGVFTVHLAYKILIHLIFHDANIFEKLNGSFSLLYGPLLFFYTVQIMGNKIGNFKILVHAAPFLVCLGLNILASLSLFLNSDIIELIDIYHNFITSIIFVSYISYSIISIRLIQVLPKSPINKLKVKIVKLITVSLLGISLLIIAGYSFFSMGISLPFNLRVIYYFILLIMFFGVIQLRIRMFLSSESYSEFKVEKKVQTENSKYKNSKINTKLLEETAAMILEYFEKEKPYLDSEFSLEDLASNLAIPKLQITQTLNMHLGTNFYQLVNNSRIELSKELIANGQENNLTVIGYESGFKSKSTFYKYFKEVTGYNPTDYKKQISI